MCETMYLDAPYICMGRPGTFCKGCTLQGRGDVNSLLPGHPVRRTRVTGEIRTVYIYNIHLREWALPMQGRSDNGTRPAWSAHLDVASAPDACTECAVASAPSACTEYAALRMCCACRFGECGERRSWPRSATTPGEGSWTVCMRTHTPSCVKSRNPENQK